MFGRRYVVKWDVCGVGGTDVGWAQLKYACQRPHPLYCPNQDFVDQLLKIRLSRILQLDEIGIRAYSTAIAAIQAYPYKMFSASEVAKLPGCDGKELNEVE